jgi:hypothetical protein
MNYFSPLKGFTDIFSYTLNNDIQDGLVEYFDWGLLDKGNYFNVVLGELSPEGEDYSRLRLSSNPNYSQGQVWEGFRKNWVWQSGVQYSPAPIVGDNNEKPGISGVYVDDVFYSSDTTGQYSHFVDYKNGSITFNNAIPVDSKVQAEHSYKWINVVYANDVPWLKEVQLDTQHPNSNFYDKDKGSWNVPTESRLQLPAIAIEVVPARTFKGYQLGAGQIVYTDVLFHCIAEDEVTRNKLVDIVSLQNNKTIYLHNSNAINSNNDYPMDYRGVPISGALQYPDLVNEYPGGRLFFKNSNVQNMTLIDSNIFGGIVRVTTEGIKLNI